MSAVVHFFEDVVKAVVGFAKVIIHAVGDLIETLWKDVLVPMLEFVAGLFGIEDEDIIETQVLTQRVIQEDIVASDLITKIALEEMKAEIGVIDRLMAYTQVVRNRYSKYFNYGDTTFVDGLPESNLRSIYINENVIKDIIDSKYGIDCTILDSGLGAVDKYYYVGFYLQENYRYTPYNNEMVYNGYVYSVGNIDYNYDTDLYDTYLQAREDQTTTTTTTTSVAVTELFEDTTITTTTTTAIIITNIDETYDNKNTTVSEQVVVVGDVSGELSNVTTEISNVDEQIATGTETDSVIVDEVVTYGTNNYADSVNTIVSERVLVIGTVQGTISDVTTELSNITEEVAIDTVVDSESVEETNSAVYDVIWDTTVLSVNSYKPVRYYYVKYYYTVDSEWHYWVYEANSGGYPALDASDTYLGNLDMLPVVTIRNSTINVNEDTGSDRYKQSKDMLKFLGIDLDNLTDSLMESPSIDDVEDAFIHFGLQPKEDSKVVSKALYETFEFIYNDAGLLEDGNKYVATLREGSFNAAIAWTAQSRVVVNGIIGSKGTYEHEISGKNLVMRYQAAEEQYVVITITNLSSITFIDRQGLTGTVAKDVDQDGFFVPLSYYFISKFSPLEQYELFNRSLLLSTYAAQVMHLEWYETDGFMDLLGVIAVVLSVVSFGYSLYTYGLAATITMTLVGIAIAVGATMLLKMVMESTDSEFLRALAAVAYVAAMVYGANAMLPTNASGLTTAVTLFATTISSVSTAISINTEIEMNKLAAEQLTFGQRVEEKEEELDKAKEALTPYMSIEDILEVTQVKAPLAYLEGVDAMMYRAIGVQYEYAKLYDYDAMVGDFYENKLRIGVI
jgi:hypothetical protein